MTELHTIDQKWIDYLKEQPEQGMGFHICDIEFDNGTTLTDEPILNCSMAKFPENLKHLKIIDIKIKTEFNIRRWA